MKINSPISYKPIILFMLLLLPSVVLGANDNKPKKVRVEFEVVYSLSERLVDPFLIDINNITDSVKIDLPQDIWRDGKAQIKLETGKKYIALVSAINSDWMYTGQYSPDPALETEKIEIDLSNVTKDIHLDQVRLHKKMQKQLGEVTVTPSRVLFYHRGDTLVYNASEFILAEGSMLDALIKQLPGVKLTPSGEIYVHNRKVDDLLLNGKDLFAGDRKLMLENIGAYTVKSIDVYEKSTDRDRILGRNMDDKRYAMDVRLKREYSIGWMINADAGYGTAGRYIGKLFGRWFSDNVNLNFRGKIDNLASQQNSVDAEEPKEIIVGARTTKSGGFTYHVDGHADKWQVWGNTSVSHTSDDAQENKTIENFLPVKNNYQYSFDNYLDKKVEFSTDHFLRLGVERKIYATLHPRLNYKKNKTTGLYVAGLFNEDVQNVTIDRLLNIYKGNKSLADTLVYRNINQRIRNGHQTKLLVPFELSLNAGSGIFNFGLTGQYDERKEDYYRLYLINHSDMLTPSTQNLQHQDLSPDYTRKLKADVSYFWDLDWNRSRFIFEYNYLVSRTVNTSNVSSVADWDLSQENEAVTIADVMSLPGMAPVFSPDLSYSSLMTGNQHSISASFSHMYPIRLSDKYALNFYTKPLDIKFSNRHYRYVKSDSPILLRKSTILPAANYSVWLKSYDGLSFGLSYYLESKDAPMQAMVTLPQTDPLYVHLGNSELKPSLTHLIGLGLRRELRNQKFHTLELRSWFYQNQISFGYVFNTVTGVRYVHPYNVNGNKELRMEYVFFTPFGRGNKFDISTTTTLDYINSVDLIGTTVETEDFKFSVRDQKRRSIGILTGSEKLKLNYRLGRNTISAFGELHLHDYRSNDSGFEDFTSIVSRYGVSGIFTLPLGIGLSTDLNVYTRRGFTDDRLNTSDIVWNAKLTKSILKGSTILIVEAFDMLHQLSNITYTVNAQARTETISNVVPAYVLFHVQYNFNKAPKR